MKHPSENPFKRGVGKPRNNFNPFRTDSKEDREKRRQRRGRVIVRNISFKATEETLHDHFSQFGKITELNLLKKPDGQMVGCAFVQFEQVSDGAKAILQGTGKEFLGRPVFVDWAVSKDRYVALKELAQKAAEDNTQVQEPETTAVAETIEMEVEKKEEESNEPEIKSEEESDDANGPNDASIEEEEASQQEDDSPDEDVEEEGEDEEEEGEDEEDDVKEEEDEEEEEDAKLEVKSEDSGKAKPKRISNDVNEGCTIFIKNVPFDATGNDLRECCKKFGPLHYAVITTDPVSGHSKGTGFVKFHKKESADMCLAAGEEFVLMGTVMEPLLALSREEVRRQKESAKEKDSTDSRNLYLVKEGLIMAGSKAAESVSASDMAKRHKLEVSKTQILKNLNRFVSRNRLSIHNLPMHYDDEKLRSMIQKFTGLKPHECRVMRENKSSVDFPRGKPKGFGFVSFKTHADAISALRKLNNNPKVFSPTSRPIVGFSIEDRSVHKIKERRVQKSREANPTYAKKLEKLKAKKNRKKEATKDDKLLAKKDGNKQKEAKKKSRKVSRADEEALDDFVGTAAKAGTIVRMRSGRKIKEQAQEHMKRVSDKKQKEKKRKEQNLHRVEKKQIDRPKKGKKKAEKDNFSLLVNNYKQLLNTRNTASGVERGPERTKWYVE